MDYTSSKSETNRRVWLIGIVVVTIIACGLVTLIGYNLLETWAKYDPKQAAKETARQCLNKNSEFCGYITSSLCLTDIYQSASESDNQYSIDVLWYNWEDEICCRGGDEVYLQIDFENGDDYRLLWYEGTLEQCEATAP